MNHLYEYEEPRFIVDHWERIAHCRCGLIVRMYAKELHQRFHVQAFRRSGESFQSTHSHSLPECTYRSDVSHPVQARNFLTEDKHRWTLQGIAELEGHPILVYSCPCLAKKYHRFNPVTGSKLSNMPNVFVTPDGTVLSFPLVLPPCTAPSEQKEVKRSSIKRGKSTYSIHTWSYSPWKRVGQDRQARTGICTNCGLQKKEGKYPGGIHQIGIFLEGVWTKGILINQLPCIKKEPPPAAKTNDPE